jgi:hypothetical protein
MLIEMGHVLLHLPKERPTLTKSWVVLLSGHVFLLKAKIGVQCQKNCIKDSASINIY